MGILKYVFKYIDDIWWINVGNAYHFLDPYWTYHFQLIKTNPKTKKKKLQDYKLGIKAHFNELWQYEVNGKFYFRKYDKKIFLPFSFMQFVKFLTTMFPIVTRSLYIKHLWFYLSNNALDGFIEIGVLVKTMIMFTTTKNKFIWLENIVKKDPIG